MNHNLAWPYNDVSSPPLTPYLSFHSPQSEDMLFGPDSISAVKPALEFVCRAGLRSVSLSWSLHRNMLLKLFLEGAAEPLADNKYRITITPENLPAGFYDLRVKLQTGTREIDGVCTFGWRAEAMAIRDSRPGDFAEFWNRAKSKLAGIPLDPRQETPFEDFDRERINAYNLESACLPADYDPSGHRFEAVESAKFSFAGPDGGRVYGWLAKPQGPGPFPAMLVLPGAGFNARPRPLEHARHGYLALDIQIHGQDVDLAEYESAPDYGDGRRYEPVEAYYYYNVHLRVLQALNYLASRSDVDQDRIVIVGGSQGGRLGVVAAGLDSRVKALVSCIANSSNCPHLAWMARCNGLDTPHDDPKRPEFRDRPKFDGMDLTGAPPAMDTVEGRTLAYHDPMNFAPDVTCPVLMNAGLIDPISPAFSVWAVYNRLGTSDKTMIALPSMAHDWSAEFDRQAWRWLEERFRLKKY